MSEPTVEPPEQRAARQPTDAERTAVLDRMRAGLAVQNAKAAERRGQPPAGD